MNSLAIIAENLQICTAKNTQASAPTIDQSRAKIYAMLDAASQGGLLWSSLPSEQRRIFCFAAGLKQSHVEKKLSDFDDLERHKLLRAIKTLAHAAQLFAPISKHDFK